MKRILLVLAMSAIALCGYSQKRDWAQFGRYEKANKEFLATGVRPDAVFMGNSITDGWAGKDPEFFKKNNFVGRGIGGQTSSEMLVRFRRDVIDLNPRCVVILAGTNDIAQHNGPLKPENTLGNIVSMCELAKANGIKVILCSVTPTSVFGWRKDLTPAPLILEMNKLIRAYAEANDIYYLDYHPALTDDKGGLPAKWSHDTCHPNLECYRTVMEPTVCDAINKVLKVSKKQLKTPMPVK